MASTKSSSSSSSTSIRRIAEALKGSKRRGSGERPVRASRFCCDETGGSGSVCDGCGMSCDLEFGVVGRICVSGSSVSVCMCRGRTLRCAEDGRSGCGLGGIEASAAVFN